MKVKRPIKPGVYFWKETGGKPIAYSTKADSDWLAYLKPLCKSWEELLSKVDGTSGEYIASKECTTVVKAYMKKKSDFDKVNWR